MAEISIIVPVYNMEKYLDDCVRSVLDQTYTDLELILVDDGSSDSSPEKCDQYAAKDSRVKVVHKKNAGVSQARNTGIEHATGNFYLFLDSDDWLELETCQKIMDAQHKNDADLVVFDMYHASHSGRSRVRVFNRPITTSDPEFMTQYQITCIGYGYNPYPTGQQNLSGLGSIGNKLYRASIIQTHELRYSSYTMEIYEDNLFAIHFLDYVRNLVYIQEPLYNYRMVENSSIHRYRGNSLIISERIFEKVQEFISCHGDLPLMQKAFYILVMRRLSEELHVYYFHRDSGNVSKRIKELSENIRQFPYSEAIKKVEVSKLMYAHKLTCITAKTGSGVIMYMGYKLRRMVKRIVGSVKRLKKKNR